MAQWRDRVVERRDEPPEQLLANPRNWRIHPKTQQDALTAVLDRVGWVQEVIVNRRTQHVVDGHLRVSLAISRGEPTIPVAYVDLSEEEEALVLATLDPLAALAGKDAELLSELVGDLPVDDAALLKMWGDMGVNLKPLDASPQLSGLSYSVIVECADEHRQGELIERLTGEGWKCRALIS